jgi:hypothetical protein
MLNGLAVFGLLLAIVSLPPVPGQAPDHRGNASHNPENQADDGKTPPKSAFPLIPKNCASEQFKDDADCKAAKDKESTVVVSKLPTANIAIQRNADRDIPDWIGYGFGILLAMVGMWGVLVARRGVIATEKAANAALESANAANSQIQMMKDKERARLVLSPLPLVEIPIDFPWQDVQVAMMNLGATDAFNVRIMHRSEITFSEVEPERGELRTAVVEVVRPSGDASKVALEITIFPQQWENTIIAGAKNLYVHLWGTVLYDDIFGDSHSLNFQYVFRIYQLNDVVERSDGRYFQISPVSNVQGWRKCQHQEHNASN